MSKCYDNPDYDDSESDIQNTWNQHPKVEQKYEAKSMKNIHVIPTPNSSRLVKQKYDTIDRLCLADMATKRAEYKRFNIYITSDEIDGFENNIWVILGTRFWLWQNTMALISNKKPRKIILTTDQDLIKDGVQAIDDEFLEYFVSVPLGEIKEVKVIKHLVWEEYKIIIPKDEHEIYTQDDYFNDEFPKEEPKQETLEEVKDLTYWRKNAEEDYIKVPISVLRYITELEERSYSEKDMIKFAYNYMEERKNKGVRALMPELLIKQFKNYEKK